jgi:hypothetical protein
LGFELGMAGVGVRVWWVSGVGVRDGWWGTAGAAVRHDCLPQPVMAPGPLGRWPQVSRVVVVASLPRNASNKVMRRVLRDALLLQPGRSRL